MPRKGSSKLKQQIRKKQQEQHRKQKQQRKQFEKELKNREPFYQKQIEEIETVATVYELEHITKSSSITTLNDDSPFSNIFDMKVMAHPGDLENNHCSINLRVSFPHYYPDEESPTFEITKQENVSKQECQSLLSNINQKAAFLRGSEVDCYVQSVVYFNIYPCTP